MKKDYLTTNIELSTIKIELAHELAQKEFVEVNNLTSEIELLKFIAIKLIIIEQKLAEE